MRFECLDAVCFGPLRDRQLELDSDIVLVYGPNEAGKSSFRAALETILFGFKPADRDAHPLAQWNPDVTDNLHIEAQIRLDTDEIQSVERVLLQTGKSRLVSGRAAFSGPRRGNACVPWATWLSRDVFAALYSLEVSQLAALNPSVRADIDELLLPTPSGLPLRLLTDVRTQLHSDHTDLWRPDNRGKPEAKKLRKLLAEARNAAAEAAEAERELRLARTERAEGEVTLERLRNEKRILDRAHAESPFLGELFEHRRVKRSLGPALDLSPLGGLPLVKPSQLQSEIEEIELRLQVPCARLEQPALALGEEQTSVSERAPEIDHALAQLPGWEADQQRRDEQLESARRARQRALDELAGVLSTDANEADLEAADSVPITGLRVAIARWSEQRERYTAAIAARGGRVRTVALALGFVGLVAVGLGSFGFVGAMLDGVLDGVGAAGQGSWLHALADPRLAPAGAVLLFASLVTALFVQPARRAESPASPSEVDELLSGLNVAGPLLESPAALGQLIAALENSVRHLHDAHEAQRLADELERAIGERQRSWASLCKRLEIDEHGRGDLLLGRLRAALESARERSARVVEDRNQRDEAARLCDHDTPMLANKRDHARCLEQCLSESSSSTEPVQMDAFRLDEAFDREIERRNESEFLRRREGELRADPRFASLERDPRVVEDLADAPWLPATVAAREQEIASLEDELGRGQRRMGELDKMLASDVGSGLARATDHVCEIEAELEAIEHQRDRLALLESILTRAERDFREDHQPDVLRRASVYLEQITDGRYCRIDLVDDNDARLCVTPAGRDQPVEVGDPISQGTLDQIFLCLRLGLLDHLDGDRERLPLVLDDALLRMDDRRRHACYRVLGEIAPHRQVFIMTCHTAIADEIAAALKVTRVSL